MNPSTTLRTSLRSVRGLTLLELMIAGTLLAVIFVAVTALQISSLGFLKGQMNAPDVNAAIAFEQMVRDVKRANDIAVSNGGQQLKLKVDTSTPADATLTGDRWIVYGFVSQKLHTKVYTTDATGPASSAPNVTSSDSEVLSGLTVDPTSSFTLMDPTSTGTSIQVKINFVVQAGGKTVSFVTTTLPSRSK